MLYLLTQISLYLIAALLIGWLLGRSISKIREQKLLDEQHELQAKYSSLEDYRDRINKDFFALKEKDKEKAQEIAHLKKLASDSMVKSDTFQQENADYRMKQEQFSLYQDDAALQQQMSNAALKIKELIARISTLVEEKNVLIAEKAELEEALDAAGNQSLSAASKEGTSNLTEEIEEFKLKEEEYQARIKALEEEHQDLSGKIQDLNKKNSDAKYQEEIEELTTQIIDVSNERDDYFNRLRTISNVVEPCA